RERGVVAIARDARRTRGLGPGRTVESIRRRARRGARTRGRFTPARCAGGEQLERGMQAGAPRRRARNNPVVVRMPRKREPTVGTLDLRGRRGPAHPEQGVWIAGESGHRHGDTVPPERFCAIAARPRRRPTYGRIDAPQRTIRWFYSTAA